MGSEVKRQSYESEFISNNMNKSMGSLSDSKGAGMPYKEALRRQMARAARLDTFFEMKRRKSKKKTRHKLEPTAEELEDSVPGSPRKFDRGAYSADNRLKCESSKDLTLNSDIDKADYVVRSKSVTFMDDKRVEPIQVLSPRTTNTIRFISECDTLVTNADTNQKQRINGNENVTESIIKNNSIKTNRGETVAAQIEPVDDVLPKISSDKHAGNTSMSLDIEDDILSMLEDTGDIKGVYKEKRSSIKTLNSMVGNIKSDKADMVLECRRMFREEILRLRHETEDFRVMCLKQIEKQKKAVEKHRKRCFNQVSVRQSTPRDNTTDLETELVGLTESMEYLQRKQAILDQETDLMNREEEIEKKQKYLEDYEHEIQDVELMLRHRQALCDRRQVALVTFDEELNILKQEIEERKHQMEKDGIDTTTVSERARQNWRYTGQNHNMDWEMLKRNMMDKQLVLENTVQKYRSELASATSKMVGKDIMIQKLHEQLKDNEDHFQLKDKKMKNLQTKLELAISEIRHLENKLDFFSSNTNNNNNNITILDKFQLAREGSADSIILRDSSQDSGIGPRDISPRNSQDSHNSHDSSPASRHSLRESPDSQTLLTKMKDNIKSEADSPSSHRSTLLLPDIPGTPMSQPCSSRSYDGISSLQTEASLSYRSFNSVEEDKITNSNPGFSQDRFRLRSKDKIVRHSNRKQSIANGNLSKLSMLKHGDDMKSGACSIM